MPDVEATTIEEEKEKEDVFRPEEMAEKSKKRLAYKRSFFVRMVSDPKIYNPKIVTNNSGDPNTKSIEEQAAAVPANNPNINISDVKIYDNVPPSPTV